MIGVLIVLLLVCLLGLLPIGVRLSYDEAGGLVWLKLGFIKILLYPQDKTEQKGKQGKKKAKKSKGGKNKPKGGNLTEFLPIAKIVFDFLSDFRKRLYVQKLYLRLTLAENDPFDLAVHYAEAWGVLGSVMPLLEQYVKIKDRDLKIDCDFTAEKPNVVARADILISFGRFLVIALRHGIRGFKKYQLISKKIKAVQ